MQPKPTPSESFDPSVQAVTVVDGKLAMLRWVASLPSMVVTKFLSTIWIGLVRSLSLMLLPVGKVRSDKYELLILVWVLIMGLASRGPSTDQELVAWSLLAPLAASPLIQLMMCGVSVSLLRLMVGVLGKAPEIVLRARRWTFSSSLQFRWVSRALIQTVHAYVRIGLTSQNTN